MTVKTYTRRDSATAALRKLGIKARDYDLFIVKHETDFSVNIAKAEAHLASLTQSPKAAIKAAFDSFKVVPMPAKPVKTDRRTVSSVCRAMIIDGKSNEEVWAAIDAEFKLGSSKKHYPSWYRAELKRTGKI